MVVAHLIHSAHIPQHKGAPIVGVMRKVNSSGGLISAQSAVFMM